MISRDVTLPELGLVAVTRAALGFGLGLLIGEHIDGPQRRAIGWTLVAVGAVTTVPLALNFFGGAKPKESGRRHAKAARDKTELPERETVESP